MPYLFAVPVMVKRRIILRAVGKPPRQLLLRWLAFGIFTPLMRNHSAEGTRMQEAYRFERLEDFRNLIGVRYRLLPYLYSEYMKAALNDDLYTARLALSSCSTHSTAAPMGIHLPLRINSAASPSPVST